MMDLVTKIRVLIEDFLAGEVGLEMFRFRKSEIMDGLTKDDLWDVAELLIVSKK
jgi:hypothetical protein